MFLELQSTGLTAYSSIRFLYRTGECLMQVSRVKVKMLVVISDLRSVARGIESAVSSIHDRNVQGNSKTMTIRNWLD